MKRNSVTGLLVAVAASAVLGGCSDDGIGAVTITTWGEEYIEKEIPAAVFEDGWSIHYTKFLVVIGKVRIADESGTTAAEMSGTKLFNHVEPGTKDVTAFSNLAAVPYTEVSYQIRPGDAFTEIAPGVTEADKTLMLGGSYSVYVEGEATKGAEKKTFAWGFGVPTLLAGCKGYEDGKETDGVIVTNGGTDTVELTIHGDHLFYDDLQGANAKLRFSAFASADTDKDGVITLEELAGVKLVEIIEGSYGTGSASDVNDLRQFVTALSRTVGHFRGEGECSVRDP